LWWCEKEEGESWDVNTGEQNQREVRHARSFPAIIVIQQSLIALPVVHKSQGVVNLGAERAHQLGEGKRGQRKETAKQGKKAINTSDASQMEMPDKAPVAGQLDGHEYVFQPIEYEEELDLSGKMPESCSQSN